MLERIGCFHSDVDFGVTHLVEVSPRVCDQCASPWPLVVFSHGSGAFRASYIYWTEFLASHGFVVVAGDHPGQSPRRSQPLSGNSRSVARTEHSMNQWAIIGVSVVRFPDFGMTPLSLTQPSDQ